MGMAQVIDFPKSDKAQSMDDWADEVRQNKQKYIDEMVEHYGSSLLDKLARHGFGLDKDPFLYDYMLVMEMLKATLYRNVGVEHPLQDVMKREFKNYFNEG